MAAYTHNTLMCQMNHPILSAKDTIFTRHFPLIGITDLLIISASCFSSVNLVCLFPGNPPGHPREGVPGGEGEDWGPGCIPS